MPDSTWQCLLTIAELERPQTREDWIAHRSAFNAWLSIPLRQQAADLREYFRQAPISKEFRSSDWEHLIPAGTSTEAADLFLTDLASLFRVLLPPVPESRRAGAALRHPGFCH